MSLLRIVMVLWGVVTVALAGLLIYRSLIAMKEDDQLFLDSAERNLEAEQQAIRLRLQSLAPYAKGLGAASGALLVVLAGVWMYQELVARTTLR